MPSYCIHIAIGLKYLEKHPEENKNKFIEGIIAPDILPKPQSHFGPYSSMPDIELFIAEKEIETSYNRGYYLHLLTDKLFYNQFLGNYISKFTKEIYNDYDKLNKAIIEKYNIILPEKIKNEVKFTDGETSILPLNDIFEFINTVAEIGFNDYCKIKAE